eukprot:g407.t1
MARPASGFYGVSAKTGQNKWQAQIYYGGEQHDLGEFASKRQAASEYDSAARQHSPTKPLNYPIKEDEIRPMQLLRFEKEFQVRARKHTPTKPQDYAIPEEADELQPVRLFAAERPRPPSGFYGVTASGDKWAAQVYYAGSIHFLGQFRTKEQAAFVYDAEARKSARSKPTNYPTLKAAKQAADRAEAGYKRTLQLQRRQSPRPASGFYGVSEAKKGKWQAQIWYGGKQHCLGKFGTKEEAALEYDTVARRRSPTKPLNYPSLEVGREAAEKAAASSGGGGA